LVARLDAGSSTGVSPPRTRGVSPERVPKLAAAVLLQGVVD